MADYSGYAQGQGGQNSDPRRQGSQAYSLYVQQQADNFNYPGQVPYGSPQISTPGSQFSSETNPGYFPQGAQGHDGGLSQQMGTLGLGGVATYGRRKKKDRHAYHTVEAPIQGSFDSIPPGGVPPSAYLNADPSTMPGGQMQSPATMSQSHFPAAVNGPYNPANPASPMEFASRNGTMDSGFSTNVQSSAQGRVNPDDIPGIPQLRDGTALHYLTHQYPTFEHHVPPPAVVPFIAYDQANASPKFARLTLNNIPSTYEALSSTGLPLGLVLQPLAPMQAGELEIPVLDFGDMGPPRCHRCRAYINPFMVFRSGGNKFVCNMCNYANDVPPEYYCATTPQGARLDREQRPELMRGTVEYLVPKEYWSKDPVGLRWLFLIDVGQESFNKGFLHGFCEGILTALYGKDGSDQEDEVKHTIPEGARVGFVTFDKDIHFYNISVCASKITGT